MRIGRLGLFAAAWLAAFATGALAQTVKVGVVLPFTGVGAEFGQQVDRGIQMFMKLNPTAFGPYKVEIVKRDSKNPSGAEAKTAVQELIAQDKVDILTGFIYSPDAIASAPLVTAAKKPMIIMNAGTAWITNLSPMISRVSFSMWHSGYAMGEAAAKSLQGEDRGGRLHRFPAGQGQPGRVQARLRGERRQGDRRDPDGRPGPGAGLHAVLPARQGQEARRVLRLRAVRRPRGRGDEDLRRARHAAGRHQADRARAT